jgi:hypothetical protein
MGEDDLAGDAVSFGSQVAIMGMEPRTLLPSPGLTHLTGEIDHRDALLAEFPDHALSKDLLVLGRHRSGLLDKRAASEKDQRELDLS